MVITKKFDESVACVTDEDFWRNILTLYNN